MRHSVAASPCVVVVVLVCRSVVCVCVCVCSSKHMNARVGGRRLYHTCCGFGVGTCE